MSVSVVIKYCYGQIFDIKDRNYDFRSRTDWHHISTHTDQVFSMILMAPLMQMVSTGAHTHTNQVNIHIILDQLHY